ncbi:putative transcription factor/ chromatin remodeling BED-type(Zn) family [Helianthus annuus]|nr:putative transcription factor/ chromatin remodeling BED-type(Zn) family [Helianthus annuus]KAJ0636230.1 putative transcription factor/ chromatin remodeling BED-type(Zn) family [Helianthus annuus]
MSAVTNTNTPTTTQPPSPPATTTITDLVAAPSPELTTDEMAVKAVHKRYEGLVMVRTKAMKGKGAWYWAHLEPSLIRHPDTGLPKAVKLRCSLCESLFSASNPSRTASEHLKRGTCPNFNSGSSPNPISVGMVDLGGSPTSSSSPVSGRKRSSGNRRGGGGGGGGGFKVSDSETTYSVAPITMIEPPRFSVDVSYPTRPEPVHVFSPHHHHHHQQQPQQQKQVQPHVVLSGGKEDLGALAMLEDSVKKLKSPKASPGQTLTKAQIDSSLELLANWVYENCGLVSFSSLEHPKFKSFLNQVGLPAVTRRELAGERLESKYKEAKAESEARIRDALFFQISSDGWKVKKNNNHHSSGEVENLVNVCVNLPNGTSVFRRGVFTSGYVFSKHAEDVLWETICDICGNNLQQCVGIVSDKFRSKVLRNLENQHHWMVNLSCQFQGVSKLVKDFSKELPLFHNVTENCFKVANFVNNKSQIRHLFLKYQLQEYGRAALLRVPFYGGGEFEPVFQMVEDVLSSARALQLVFLDESCKMVSMEDQTGKEIEEMMMSQFWSELEAVHSLVGLIKGMAREIEKEKPRIGQCLPLWEELRVKIKEWCGKFHINENHVDKVFDNRFRRNYHPAWSAAFILDPFYMVRDTSGKYLPPFKYLTSEQEKDVDQLITRLVSREEAHIALMELMKWRTEGLDPMYAQAVQLKQRDPITGQMKIANPQSSRLVWETHLTDFKYLRKVAMRLIFLHATSCGFKWSSSICRWAQSRTGMDKAQKLIFIAAQSKLERRDFSNDEDKDAEFFSMASREDDVLNDVMFDASSL